MPNTSELGLLRSTYMTLAKSDTMAVLYEYGNIKVGRANSCVASNRNLGTLIIKVTGAFWQGML